MNKPIITVKQRDHITVLILKGVPFAYAVMTNKIIKKHGIVNALLMKASLFETMGLNKRANAHHKLASVLKA